MREETKRRQRRAAEHTLQLEVPTMMERLRLAEGRRAALVVLAGLDMGRTIPLDRSETVLGRDPDCHAVIRDDGISRRHAEVRRRGNDDFEVVDLGSTNGVFVAGRKVERHELTEGDKILLGRGTVLQLLMLDPVDEQFRLRMYESTVRDGLTGAFNRKHFDERLSSEISFARRHGSTVSLLLFDLDHFKRVNDTWGHPAGDLVLQTVAAAVQDRLRGEDVLARWGGEEFAVIARGIGELGGLALGERLRREVEELRIVTPEGDHIPVTISVGVATAAGRGPQDETELVTRADRNLYLAKQRGRNRVEAGDHPTEE